METQHTSAPPPLRAAPRNIRGLWWHGFWLAASITFTEFNTVLPSLVMDAGGREIHIGILTAIMIGVPLIAQLGFAGYLHGRPRKKPFLMLGIHVRVVALAGAAVTVGIVRNTDTSVVLGLLYLWMLLFSLSGAFAGISYTDITGKAIPHEDRRHFFVLKQTLAAIGVLAAALAGRALLSQFEYPTSYRMMFFAAAASLFVATAGFWAVREPTAIGGANGQADGGIGRPSYREIMRSIPGILRRDRTLRMYILASNLVGLSITLVPFYVALGRSRAVLSGDDVGTLLLVQIGAMVVSNVIWAAVAKRRGFKGVFRWLIILGAAGPIVALALTMPAVSAVFPLVFLLAGSSHSADHIARDAILVEITDDNNRALYTGIFGTLNLTRALFPIASGAFLAALGYSAVFLIVAVVSLAALPLLRGMDCPIDRR